jgi:hypothetical protein
VSEINELVDRYVAVWNQPDAELRRRGIAELWTEDGMHLTPSLEARGYEAIETRVAGAYQRFVEVGGYLFRATANTVDGHHNVVRFNWEMVPATGGAVEAAGFDFLILGDDGRIRYDYQFANPVPAL